VVFEPLEQRQLMSLTVDIRAAGGGKSAVVTTNGTVLNLQIWATITGQNNDATQDALVDVDGSILGTGTTNQAVGGNLSAAIISMYAASGAQPGTSQDLNGDGNKDVGGTDPSQTAGFFIARAGAPQTSTTAGYDSTTRMIVGGSLEFLVGNLTYTVTNLHQGGETDLTFLPRPSSSQVSFFSGVWAEDGVAKNNTNGTFTGGAAFKISDPAITPAPTAVDDSFTAVKNTPIDLNELTNDTAVGLVDPATVTINTAPMHGTATVQGDGTIQYTPANNFIGSDSFTYSFTDQNGRASNTATADINVLAFPLPVAAADSATTPQNLAVDLNVLANDSATAPATITAVNVSAAPAHGTAVVQSDKTVLYTPANGFVGTDSFSYTVTDSNGETSNPAAVSLTMTSTPPPTAVADSAHTQPDTAATISVLANDTPAGGTMLVPGTVAITSTPAHGTAVAQSNGTVLYTPAHGFVGADSFAYTVQDNTGQTSAPATVSLSVSIGLPPIAVNDSATVGAGQATPINVLANDTASGSATLISSSVAVAAAPTNGTAVAQSDGTILYTSNAGFIGADSFTYTVADSDGGVSTPATVAVNVGAELSNAKGANHSLTYTDASGAVVVVKLNRGTADITFAGSGTLTVAKGGRATMTGTGLSISNIALSNTTAGSVLSIHAKGGTATLGGVTDTGALGSIVAPTTNLTGTLDVGGLGNLRLLQATNATIHVGNAGAAAVGLALGSVSDSSINSTVPIRSLKLTSWTNIAGNGRSITAPSMNNLTDHGSFEPDLTLSGTGSNAPALGAARIGALDGGTWTITGNVRSINAASVTSDWTPTISGALGALVVRGGGLSAAVTAGSIGSLNVVGDLLGNVTAASAKSIRVTGNITGSNINLSDTTTSLNRLAVCGAISGSGLIAAGNILTVSAASISDSLIVAGVQSGTTVDTATAANLGTAIIRSVRLTSRTTFGFSNTQILAGTINSASLGAVNTDNGGNPQGLAAVHFNTVTGVFNGDLARLGKKQLTNNATLATFLFNKVIHFGDFRIQIAT
jgi:hypothetical protein